MFYLFLDVLTGWQIFTQESSDLNFQGLRWQLLVVTYK